MTARVVMFFYCECRVWAKKMDGASEKMQTSLTIEGRSIGFGPTWLQSGEDSQL